MSGRRKETVVKSGRGYIGSSREQEGKAIFKANISQPYSCMEANCYVPAISDEALDAQSRADHAGSATDRVEMRVKAWSPPPGGSAEEAPGRAENLH